jgi:uncharacterized repeat protein (TIGR01451 family)
MVKIRADTTSQKDDNRRQVMGDHRSKEGGRMDSKHRALRGALLVTLAALLAGALSPSAGLWGQPFPLAQSPEPPVGAAPTSAAPIPSAEPIDPPTPAVSLHVRAPAVSAPGQEIDYRILIENTSKSAAHHVMVRAPLPANAAFVRASPGPSSHDGQVIWELGTLQTGTSKELLLTLKPSDASDVDVTARVQFEHGESVRTRIGAAARQPLPSAPAAPMPTPPAAAPPAAVPKAVLRLRKTGPAQAPLNDIIQFHLEVTNVGTADAVNVEVRDSLPSGLQYLPRPGEQAGSNLIWPAVAALRPGKTWRAEYSAIAKEVGDQENVAQATAGGDLRERASWKVRVHEPKLAVTVTRPQKALLNAPTKYEITISNNGVVALTGVEVFDELPEGATFVRASDGGRPQDGRIHWLLGNAPPGRSRSVTVELKVAKEGEVVNKVTAKADRGVTAHAEAKTQFEGAAGIHVEIDAKDKLPVGGESDYVIRVMNRGTGAAKNLQLTAVVPEQLQVVSKEGPTEAVQEKQTFTFAPLAVLAAGQEKTYKIHVKAIRAGEVKLIVELKTDDLTTPLHEEEATTIFGELGSP